MERTAQNSYGNGNTQFPTANVHAIPTTPLIISIQGVTHYGMPILALLNKTYDVSGDVSFTPKEGESYVVKGILGGAGSSVWIENSKGGIEGAKIEAGPSK